VHSKIKKLKNIEEPWERNLNSVHSLMFAIMPPPFSFDLS